MAANLGFFLGGLAQGYQDQSKITNQAFYQQEELKIQQRALQQQQQNQQRAEFMKLRSQAVQDMQNTVTAVKNAHPDWTDMQVASFPAIVAQKNQLAGFDKNLGLPDASDSIVAGLVAGKSQIETEGALARAKEGPLGTQLKQSEIEKNRAVAGSYPQLNTPADTGATPKQGTATPEGGGTQFIKTPMTPRQLAIIENSGATPAQFDFDATMYAYGNTNVTTGYRSYHGVNPVTVMRSRAAQYWMDKFPGEMGPQQANSVMTEFRAMQHGANTAASIDARMTQSLAKSENTAAIIVQPGKDGKSMLDKVDRTRFKDWNDFMVNVRARTGNQDEVRLGIALETLASNFGSTLGMGNTMLTDFQTKRAEDMLKRGWDKGQMGAAVDQILQEINREEAGTRQGMRRFIGGMQKTMNLTDDNSQITGVSVKNDPLGLR